MSRQQFVKNLADFWNACSQMLKKLQDSVKSSQNLASQLLTRVEASTKRYEFVMDRERLLERTFRRDLGEVGHFFDLFMRLYKLVNTAFTCI